ncbi:class I SAM-dependent methyltransferase [Motilibacter deserti]|uniref:Class I SAM-dependent methyltransferase n=1 Tax=Motilibacter deserti TaxID=2714956 RepID=A0ABX0GU46_9ACTN|nr:class I SAM-dependent methyltransferase [Motilibacter deserti]NHC14413.1 class I SAM-dependent methyltransferase [Motilibacter deserti]
MSRAGIGGTVRRRLVESPGSLGEQARSRRAALVRDLFPDLADMDVIDLGGRTSTWAAAPVRPRSVLVINLEQQPELPEEDWLRVEHGDACELPTQVRGRAFDVVFSNSVLEHVGGHDRRQRFAESVHTLAPRHWVQTPYRYFPVEPHWLFPGMQFLPLAARSRIARHWPLVHTRPDDDRGAVRDALGVELSSITELRYYFPGSQIHKERIGGLIKSIVAVKP